MIVMIVYGNENLFYMYAVPIILCILMLIILLVWIFSTTVAIKKKHNLLKKSGYSKQPYAFDKSYNIELFKWVNMDLKKSIEEVRVQRISYRQLKKFIEEKGD